MRAAALLALLTIFPTLAPAEETPPPLPQQGGTEAPPPLPQPAAVQYFAGIGGQQQGPFSELQMVEKIGAGEIKRDTLVWAQGWPAWKAADQVAELAPLFAGAPPPLPQPSQQSVLDEKMKRYLLGEWTSQFDVAGVPGAQQAYFVRYNADGSFSGYMVQSYLGQQATSPLQGRWKVQAINDTKFNLTLTPQGTTPSSTVLLIVDQNTLRDENDGTVSHRTGM